MTDERWPAERLLSEWARAVEQLGIADTRHDFSHWTRDLHLRDQLESCLDGLNEDQLNRLAELDAQFFTCTLAVDRPFLVDGRNPWWTRGPREPTRDLIEEFAEYGIRYRPERIDPRR